MRAIFSVLLWLLIVALFVALPPVAKELYRWYVNKNSR